MNTAAPDMDTLKIQQIVADMENLNAETRKMFAETAQIRRSTWWQPVAALSSAMVAGAAIFGAALALLKYLGH